MMMMMHIIHISSVVFVFFIVLSRKTDAGLTDQLLDIFKRFIQSNCSCSPYHCCSKWGYCGLTNAYCGEGCQSGPCKTRPTKSDSIFNITSNIFQCVFPDIDTAVRTRRFHGLTNAMIQMKWKPINSIEAAIFLAHISYETDGLKTLVEDCLNQDTCDNYQSSRCLIQANPNRKYFGRGMLQLSYPCHYYEAGKALGLDLLNNPELVSRSNKVAAATAIWYYKQTGMNELARQGDFGGTTRRLNQYQCSSIDGYSTQLTRVNIYHKVRKCFSLPETSVNLTC